jgi:hypothetical protein
MARTVNDAFDVFVGWLTPTGGETQAAASHRASIESCLRSNFGITGFFRSGSFGHGTSVSGHSDVDYFAVIPNANLKENSNATLQEMRSALQARFPRTAVTVRSPAVVVPFGSGAGERHEITPAEYIKEQNRHSVYDIPDRYGGWMKSSPGGHNAWVNEQNDRLGKKVKPLIRLVKAWNYRRSVGIRSFYLELRTTEYAKGETSIIYRHDVLAVFRQLRNKELAAMQDPLGISGYVHPCTDAVKADALSKLDTAIARATKAMEAESGGRVREAFEWWDLVFAGAFPAYY